MKKLFNVTQSMESMSHDQLKGAVRNMELIANAMAVTLEELLNEQYSTDEKFNVLTMSANYWSEGIEKIYLPSIDGGTVIIPTNRPDLLMRWKLEFFSKFGNLVLDAQFFGNSAVQVDVDSSGLLMDGYSLYVQTKQERERSDAALYDSMSKSKKF
jgi:hypothetical protein